MSFYFDAIGCNLYSIRYAVRLQLRRSRNRLNKAYRKKRNRMKEIDYIQWKSEFETGIEKIDEGRLQFIKLHNQLIDIVAERHCEKKTMEFIYSLIHYAEHHLLNEEICYQSFDGLAEHKARHQTFVSTISDSLNHMTNKDNHYDCQKLLIFLNNWFYEHIMKNDKTIIEAIKHL